MNITSDLIEDFLKCPTKCFLRSREEVGTGNAYAQWVRIQGELYRNDGTIRLLEAIASDKRSAGPAAIGALRTAQCHLAVSPVALSENLESSCHAVERTPPVARGQSAQYVPIRFVFSNKPTRPDKLLLAFDAHVLSKALGRRVGLGRIVYGDDRRSLKVKTSDLASEVRKLTEKASALLSGSSPPELVLNRHCVECEFQSAVGNKPPKRMTFDLSLLSTMPEKERMNLHNKGIFTVNQLSYTFRPRRRPKGQRDGRERYHHSLKALAVRENKIHIVGCPEFKIEGTPVYLDVESLPHRDFYYLIGVRSKVGGSTVQHSRWADSPSDEAQIWREFLSVLVEVENPVLIHYGNFEALFLRRMQERYGGGADWFPGSESVRVTNQPRLRHLCADLLSHPL